MEKPNDRSLPVIVLPKGKTAWSVNMLGYRVCYSRPIDPHSPHSNNMVSKHAGVQDVFVVTLLILIFRTVTTWSVNMLGYRVCCSHPIDPHSPHSINIGQ